MFEAALAWLPAVEEPQVVAAGRVVGPASECQAGSVRFDLCLVSPFSMRLQVVRH